MQDPAHDPARSPQAAPEPLPDLTRPLAWGLPGLPGFKGELCIVALFALAAVVLTWPIAITLDKATGLRGDYFNNIWNAWWMRKALGEGVSPFWTDFIYYPDGISLKRHTLSLLNAGVGGILGAVLSPHVVFNVMLLGHLVLSGWCFSLLARHVTGSTRGGILGGLLYSFAPFHFYYICQVNVFTFEFVPLALLFYLRYHGAGRRGDLVGIFLSMLAIATSTSYFVMYAFLLVGLIFVAGRWCDPRVRFADGARRLAIGTAVGALAVAIGSYPLLSAMFGSEAALEAASSMSDKAQGRRENDLFGYFWLGGPEQTVVSWPTMLGYGTLLLIAVGYRGVRRHRFWLLVAGLFFVFSLGGGLSVGLEETGIPMPFALAKSIPVLSMLRKADRFFFVIQFAVSLLAAAACADLLRRYVPPARRWLAFGGVTALLLFELNAVPFQRYDYDAPRWLAELAQDPTVTSVTDAPPMDLDVVNARYLLGAVAHKKKMTLGYTTSMAVSKLQEGRMLELINKYLLFCQTGQPTYPKMLHETGVDLILHHKTMPRERERDPVIDGQVLWAPFFLVRRNLMDVRQSGRYVDQPIHGPTLDAFRALFVKSFGQPIHEDDEVMVFRTRGR